MPYQPDEQRLIALGFHKAAENEENLLSEWHKNDHLIYLWKDGDVWLQWDCYGTGDPTLVFQMPSEQFFDQLMAAINW